MIRSRDTAITICGLAALAVAGCRQPSVAPTAPASQPKTAHVTTQEAPKPDDTESAKPAKAPVPTTTQTTVITPGRIVVTVTDPNQPQRGWLVIEEIAKPGRTATAIGRIAGPRKLLVTTKNVKIIRIELPKAGLPGNRSVVLRIDDQGIEITGRRGPTARFERSLQGVWSAKRKKR